MPISTPDSYAAELAEAHRALLHPGDARGHQGAQRRRVSPRSSWSRPHRHAGQLLEQLQWFLGQFDRGLLFYYLGNVDLISHMMWRSMDPDHPAYDAEWTRPTPTDPYYEGWTPW